MWLFQGDVYHLVFELGEWLDGRVWPSSDELEVLRLVDFIEHVTGKAATGHMLRARLLQRSAKCRPSLPDSLLTTEVAI